MACDFCREIERVADQTSGVEIHITLNDRLTVDRRYEYREYEYGETASFVIRYCPMCGQDLRKVIHADS